MTWDISVTDDIEACVALRREVFILEQGVSQADEVDGKDGEAIHVLALAEGKPVGTARLLIIGKTGKVGRVAVVKSQRGTGLGTAIMEFCVAHLKSKEELDRIALGAQEYAIGFYEKIGFKVCGPVFDDAGIPHREMEILL